MHVLLVYNPTAGSGEVSLPELTGRLHRAGHSVEAVSKQDESLAKRLREPADLVAIAGGDGTVIDVAVRLPEPSPSLAILPQGTANNIAASLGIDGALEELITAWPASVHRPFDLWHAIGPWGQRLIVEGCGFGLLTWTASEMMSRDTEALDAETRLAAARRTLDKIWRRRDAIALRAELDGERLEGHYRLFEILNISYAGPRLKLAPHADVGDGQLDVAFLAADDTVDALSPHVRRCKQIRMSCRGGRARLDDELWPEEGQPHAESDWEVQILPAGRSLTMLVPPNGP
jgi:diacylglycerol kinase (ATP)